jgi:hypothetical protein
MYFFHVPCTALFFTLMAVGAVLHTNNAAIIHNNIIVIINHRRPS